MAEKQAPMGNPAVVGLAGFGLTTLLLQLHNLGLCGLGPVLCSSGVAGVLPPGLGSAAGELISARVWPHAGRSAGE